MNAQCGTTLRVVREMRSVAPRGDRCAPTLAASATGRRRGVILIIVMVCLLLLSLMSIALLRLATFQRLQVRRDELRQQARWLAESAASRASARVRLDPKYVGETWEVAPEDLEGEAGRVRIEIPPGEAARTLTVVVHYPVSDPYPVQYTHEWKLRTRVSTNP